MIPISIKIKGIYSYETEQSIDFTDLASEGLFGIFGKVGSGKSAIIEAMSIALYGKTERFSHTGMAANILNLNSNEGYIEFTFENYKGKQYRTIVIYKRTKSRINRTYKKHIWKNGDWEATEEEMDDIIGISYDNFKRSILIPQGQFREFIELRPADRNKMMMELFQLERFDLSEKTARLLKQTELIEQNQEGELKVYKEAMEVDIKTLEEELLKQQQVLKEKEKSFTSAKEKEEQLKKEAEAWQKWKKLQDELQKLVQQKDDIDLLEKEYKKHYYFYHHIKNPLALYQKNNNDKKDKEKILVTTQYKKNQFKKDLITIQEKLNELIIAKEKWPIVEAKIKEFEYIIEVQKSQLAFQQIAVEEKTILQEQEKQLANEQSIKEAIENLQKTIQALPVYDNDLLNEVRALFIQSFPIQEDIKRLNKDLENLAKEKEAQIQYFKEKNVPLEGWRAFFEDLTKKNVESREKVQKEINHLQLKKGINHLSHELKEGEACLLCGSLEHPNPLAKDEHIDEALVEMNSRLAKLSANNDRIQQVLSRCETIMEQMDKAEKQKEKLKEEIKSKQSSLNSLSEQDWGSYQMNDTEQFKKDFEEAKKIRQEKDNLAQRVEKHQGELVKLQENKEVLKDKINQFITQKAVTQSKKENALKQIEYLDIKDFEEKGEAIIQDERQELSLKVQKEKEEFEILGEKKNQLEKDLSAITSSIRHLKEDLDKVNKEINEAETILLNSAKALELLDMESILSFAQIEFNLSSTQEKISSYKQEVELKQKLLANYDDGVQDFKQEDLVAITESVKVLNQEREALLQKIAVHEKHIAEQKERQAIYKEKSKALAVTQQRKNNLELFRRLFMAKGFVNFASVYWLKRLIHFSNQYFERLTHNQLSIDLNEDNDFIIIDYLNGGQSRSVQSLSGGQSFQLSLSLALALAESVQSNLQADQQFFFIDEGFGTLDDESIEELYQTLLYLAGDKKTIGIISHVQALQEQIPKQLRIEKRESGGSVII